MDKKEATPRKGGHKNKKTNSAMHSYGSVSKVMDDMISGMSMEQIGRSVGISKQAVFQWLMRQEPKYREIVADSIAGETLEIADDESIDPRARTIRCNQRNWILSRRFRNYSDRQSLEVTGANGAPLLQPIINLTLSAPGPTITAEADDAEVVE